MAGKVHTDSEALYAVRSAITKFAGSFQEAQGNFSQCFEQMNYQVEDHIRMLDSDIESCEEEKRVLQRQVEECEEKQSTAQREQSQHQNGRTDSFVCDRCGTRMMLKVYGDSTSCKSSSGCSGTMHRFFNDGEYHRLNVEIQQLEEKKRQLQERIAALDERIGKREAAKGRTEKNYSVLQMHQQSIMSLLVFGSGEDPETAVAFIDKALASLGDYQAVGFDVDGEGEKKTDPSNNLSSGDPKSLRLASELPRPKVLKRNEEEAVAAGMRAIDAQMDAIRDDCADKGIYDPNEVEAIVQQRREEAEIEFYNDLFGKVDEKTIAAFSRLSAFFAKDTWATLNEIEREDALNTLAVDVGTAYRTDIKGVVFYNASPQSRGYYNGDGYLYLNSDCLSDPKNRVDALDTIFHEGRHAFQRAAVNDPHRHGITVEQASIWDNNFRHYLRSDRFGYDRYYSQPVEADAFSFAGYIISSGGIR